MRTGDTENKSYNQIKKERKIKSGEKKTIKRIKDRNIYFIVFLGKSVYVRNQKIFFLLFYSFEWTVQNAATNPMIIPHVGKKKYEQIVMVFIITTSI